MPLFEHKKKSDNLSNRYLLPLFLFPLLGMFLLFQLEVELWLKIFGGIMLLLLSISFYRNTPFSYDRIIVTKRNLVFQKSMERQVIPIEEIESFSTGSRLSIKMKNGKSIEVDYSHWMMGFEKTKALQEAIERAVKQHAANEIGG